MMSRLSVVIGSGGTWLASNFTRAAPSPQPGGDARRELPSHENESSGRIALCPLMRDEDGRRLWHWCLFEMTDPGYARALNVFLGAEAVETCSNLHEGDRQRRAATFLKLARRHHTNGRGRLFAPTFKPRSSPLSGITATDSWPGP